MKDFKNKVAVITGAGSGMGRYLAILLAKAGANIAICEINEETLSETNNLLQKYPVNVSNHVIDIANKAAVEELPNLVQDYHGCIDLVFNNAGVTVDSPFEHMSETDWDWVMDINLQGVINSTRAFLPFLKARPEAALINTSSIFGMITQPNQSVYHTTKFAIRGFTECIAKELKNSNVQIHCVHPGHIGTNIVSNGRMNLREGEVNPLQKILGNLIGIGSTQEELAEFFKNNGMHPSRASNIILKGVIKNRSRILIGADALLMDLSQRLFPVHYEKIFPVFMIPLTIMRNKKPLRE